MGKMDYLWIFIFIIMDMRWFLFKKGMLIFKIKTLRGFPPTNWYSKIKKPLQNKNSDSSLKPLLFL